MQSLSWIRDNGKKLDLYLKRKLIRSYRPLRKTPCFLQRMIRRLIEHVSTVPVIIQTDGEVTEEKVKALKKHVGAFSRFSVKRRLPLIQSVSAKMSVACLKKLCGCKTAARLYLDREVKTVLDTAAPSIGSAAARQSGITGKDVTIAVIDTGIYPHPDLTESENRIIGFRDFVNNRSEPYDDNGHGTHVAGDAAGNGGQSGGQYAGPASEANLVGIKVLDRQGSGQLSTVIQGIEWCVQNRDQYSIRILSMSLGAEASTGHKDDPVCQAVEKAWSEGIVVVVAAGNEGPQPGTIASPGISPAVITVGAADDQTTVTQTDDTIADFSSRGPTIDGLVKPDVAAPGVAITSLRSPDSFLDKTNAAARVGEWYFTLSGTSMATPVVSGAVAQLLQLNPTLTPNQVKSLLKEQAFDLGLDPNAQGSGEIKMDELLG